MDDYNALPVHVGWLGDKDGGDKAEQNRSTYLKLQEVCEFGNVPKEDKAVLRVTSERDDGTLYRALSNPLGIDDAHLALFCDRGSLVYGYSRLGPMILVKAEEEM